MEQYRTQFATAGLTDEAGTFGAAKDVLPPVPSPNLSLAPGLMEGTEMKPFKDTMNHMAYHLHNIQAIDETTMEWLKKKESVMSVLWPTKEDKLRRDINWKLFTENGNLRLNLYKVHAHYTLASIRDNFNARLVVSSGIIRHQTADFMSGLFIDLVAKIQNRTEELGGIMDKDYTYNATILSPGYKKAHLETLQKKEVKYLDHLQKGIDHFQQVMELQIQNLK